MRQWIGRLTMLLLLSPGLTAAGEADVLRVEASAGSDGLHRFTVTVQHADSGWDHYADRWEVRAPDGAVLGTRVLHHPHVGEQPFTRGLGGVQVPAELDSVRVRAHDSVHGYGGAEVELKLDR